MTKCINVVENSFFSDSAQTWNESSGPPFLTAQSDFDHGMSQ